MMAADDNFLAPPVDQMDAISDAGSSQRSHHCPDIDQAQNEEELIDAIQHEIDDLIKEDTLPTVLKWFRNIDVNYMMPMFKRPMNDAKSAERATEEVEAEQAEGGQEDHFFKA